MPTSDEHNRIDKDEIYNQIDKFLNKRIGKSKLYEIRFYVDTDMAKDLSQFVKYIFENEEDLKSNKNKIKKVIDLCFGSGNLTSHILLENDIGFETLVFNDKNEDNVNKDIEIGTQSYKNFLNSSDFDNTKYDLIIFNPQIGGKDTYPDGAIDFEKSINPIITEKSFEDFLKNRGIDIAQLEININNERREISIHSEKLNKSTMNEYFKDIKIFNYYDVFYQSKDTKKEGNKTNVVSFRKTLDKLSEEKSIIIFLGEDDICDLLFKDYQYKIEYKTTDKNLYILRKTDEKNLCYEKEDNTYIECKGKQSHNEKCKESFDDIYKEISIDNQDTSVSLNSSNEEDKQLFNKEEKGSLTFPYKNILFKGVPGTGKSRAVDNIIKNQLKIDINSDNVLRINIHSASSNADLMQGIGIGSNGGQIEYKEKQGLVMDLIKRATFTPNQPFVLVLEEIQENSLNELIGDLIYLIEDSKRANVSDIEDGTYSYQELIEKAKPEHFVKIPYLVSDKTVYRKMILPNNLYVFCTSNYRDDKKVIEDNLLRRFEVIEIYPDKTVVSKDYQKFFESLNSAIREVLADEIHPDRYMIGHAIWMGLSKDEDFYRAYLKLVIEFKDIREIDFPTLKKILQKVEFPENIDSFISGSNEAKDYFELISNIQNKIDYKSLWKDENNQ